MKKILSVVLALCMLLATAVSAMADKVYQDNAAPAVSSTSDAEGKETLAVIRDAQGQIIGAVPADGVLNVVCVGERETVADAAVAAQLETGLATMLKELDILYTPGMVGTDLFYLEVPAEYAEQFAQGAAMEITFAPIVMEEDGTVMVLTSADGVTWTQEDDVTFPAAGLVTVRVNASGLVAFVVKPETAFGQPEEVASTAEEAAEETNNNFTPSVGGKLAPEIVPAADAGEEYAAVVVAPDTTPVAYVPYTPWLVLTALSERAFNPDVMTYEHLEWAYDAICKAEHVCDMKAEGEENLTLADVINKRFADAGRDLTAEDLVVSDLFEISVYGEYPQAVTGNKLSITFDMNMAQDETLVVLCAYGIDAWHVVDAQDVVINADGSVTLNLQHLGVLSFLVENPNPVDANADDVVMAP
nr:hypothetical protein [Clostridia bacterium]